MKSIKNVLHNFSLKQTTMEFVKSGFLLLFLQIIRSGFVVSGYECVFSGKDFVTFGKDIIDGRMPSRFTLLGTNDQDHIDSFRIEVICDETQNQKSVLVTALKKQIQFNPTNVTVDQVAQLRDVSIIIPPLRVDVLQERGGRKVNLNIGISVQYTPPDSGKIIIFDDYTGTHNLSGACGNPWKARRADHDDVRRRLFKFFNDKPKKTAKAKKSIMPKKTPKPKIPTRHGTPNLNKMAPDFGKTNNRRYYPRQGKDLNNPQMNSKNPDDRFQDPRIYPNCYLGGTWRMNGSMWMTADCSRIFTCTNSFVTHRKSPGCSAFADCVPVRHIGICRCRPGFIGSGFTCVYIQDKFPPKNKPNNAPHHNFATPVVPKKIRQSKKRPFVNPHKPKNKNIEKQKPTNSFHINGPKENPDLHRKPFDSGVGNDRNPIRKRPLTKTAPKNHQPPRTHPDKMKSRQKPGTKVFDRPNKPFNRYDRGRQPGKNPGKVIKLLKQNSNPFKKNRGHPRNMEKNKGIQPKKNTFPQRNRLFPVRNQIIGKGRRIPPRKIPNNFRPHGKEKPKKTPIVPMNNREKLLREIIKELLKQRLRKNQNKSPKPVFPFSKGPKKLSPDNKDPINRLTNPKHTDLRFNRPHKKNTLNRKRPHVKPLRYKKPARSDIKRVTDIIRSVNKKVTNPSLPTHTSLSTTTTLKDNTVSASPARLASTTINYINPVSKTSVESNFFYYSSLLPTGIRHVGTQPTRHTSADPPLLDHNRRLLPKGDKFIPSVNNIIRKKPVVDNNILNKTHRYPTADGTIDGLLIEPPSEWPKNRAIVKPINRDPNIPVGKKVPNYSDKKPNMRQPNRPSINRPKPKGKSNLDELFRKCKLNGSGCSKINAMGFTGTAVPVTIPGFRYPVSVSTNPNSFRGSTHAVTAPYSTKKASTNKIETKFTTDYVAINRKVQQSTTESRIKTEKPMENVRLQPPSIEEKPGKTEPKHEKCDDDSTQTGLRYKMMRKIKHSVEEIQT